MSATNSQFLTKGGLTVERRESSVALNSALDPIFLQIDTNKGVIFSSGFDYPGRHSRWEMGFVNPAIEFVAKKKAFSLNSLNEQGVAVLSLLGSIIKEHPHLTNVNVSREALTGEIIPPPPFIPEEQRSKQPSIFSVLRVLLDYFNNDSDDAALFGFYGAFGYDLIFQFEQIEHRLERGDDITDCHLFLPLEIIAIDRKKEIATKIEYRFDTPLGSTKDFPGGGVTVSITPGQGSEEIVCDNAPGEFAEKVKKVIEGTKKGDYFEVVLSQSF